MKRLLCLAIWGKWVGFGVKMAGSGLGIFMLIYMLIFMGIGMGVTYAVQPEEMLKDPQLEQRARDLSINLRCLVCPNQSIDDSNAPLARDLRLLVRERLVAGDSDQDVLDFIVARYGQYVLLAPPFNLTTVFLWISPFIAFGLIFLLGVAVFKRHARHRADPEVFKQDVALQPEEAQRLKDLLAQPPPNGKRRS